MAKKLKPKPKPKIKGWTKSVVLKKGDYFSISGMKGRKTPLYLRID